jgi:predicted DCC family thiol-disulfide oxidoreductase YuxK
MSASVHSLKIAPPVRGVVWGNVILYDGVCNFCNGCVNFVRRFDTGKKFTFAPLQSVEGKSIMESIDRGAEDLSSVVYIRRRVNEGAVSEQEVFDKSDAAIHVLEELFGLPKTLVSLVCTMVPKRLRDGVYNLVAYNRYRIMGKREDCGCSPMLPPQDTK